MAAIVGAALLAGAPGWYNGTPGAVPASFDCKVRAFALQYGQKLAPHRGQFKTLYDALQLHNCPDAGAPPTESDAWAPPEPVYPADGVRIYVDADRGDDAGTGESWDRPLRTMPAALAASRASRAPSRHLIVRGSHYIHEALRLTADDSGLHILGEGGATLTGAVKLPGLSWAAHKIPVPTPPPKPSFIANKDNVFGEAHAGVDSPGIPFLGIRATPQACQAECNATATCLSWTWHPNTTAMGAFRLNCFGRTTAFWQPRGKRGIYSGQAGRLPGPPCTGWVAKIPDGVLPAGTGVLGLRINGRRGIRARYPNADPETASSFPPWVRHGYGGMRANHGWQTAATDWTPLRAEQPVTDLVSGPGDWPGVEWPSRPPPGSRFAQTGTGDFGSFVMGTGGTCGAGLGSTYEPPYGYYCSTNPPRGKRYIHRPPVAMAVGAGVLPNAPYSNISGAVVQAWMPDHWYSNAYAIGSQDTASPGKINFTFSSGGNQGSIGQAGKAGEWYVENVIEELDSPMEWFYDAASGKLHFVNNGTGPPLADMIFEAVTTKVLLNYTGSQAAPIRNVSIRGMAVRDTAPTFLDPHGAPSGGDWGLQRKAAVMLEGTENALIDGSLFTRLDGLGIFIAGYNRNATVSNSTFEWIGASAIAAWGDTSTRLDANGNRTIPWPRGPDARDGNQPIGTRIVGNIVHDIGVWQKQSSFWFQATTAQSYVAGNVHFNGPRAGINFNDGMGGGDEITDNLLANTCRESGDHGPFNSWDRVPYITTIGLNAPRPSVFPAFRNIHHNFMLANYNSQEAIDNDDGSSFYNTHHNFFVYGDAGLKSDFAGHDNHHTSNVYAYVGGAFGTGVNLSFVNNSVVLRGDHGYASDCGNLPPGMKVSGNKVFTPGSKLDVCGHHPLNEWVASGHDAGTTLAATPDDNAIIAMGRELLGSLTQTLKIVETIWI